MHPRRLSKLLTNRQIQNRETHVFPPQHWRQTKPTQNAHVLLKLLFWISHRLKSPSIDCAIQTSYPLSSCYRKPQNPSTLLDIRHNVASNHPLYSPVTSTQSSATYPHMTLQPSKTIQPYAHSTQLPSLNSSQDYEQMKRLISPSYDRCRTTVTIEARL